MQNYIAIATDGHAACWSMIPLFIHTARRNGIEDVE